MITLEDIVKANRALNAFYLDTERMAGKLSVKDRSYDWMTSYMFLQGFLRDVQADIRKDIVDGVDNVETVDNVDNFEPAEADSGVSHPSHYQTESGLECIEVMREVFGDEAVKTFAKLNAFKYIWRSGKKAGEADYKDLEKATFYLSELNKEK